MQAQRWLIVIPLLVPMLSLLPACKSAGDRPGTAKSSRWSELSNSFRPEEAANYNTSNSVSEYAVTDSNVVGKTATENNAINSAGTRPKGTEHFRNLSGPTRRAPINFQAHMDQQQQEYEPNGRLRMTEGRPIDQIQQWKQYWRDNPNDVPVMTEWYKDDFR